MSSMPLSSSEGNPTNGDAIATNGDAIAINGTGVREDIILSGQ